MARDAVSRAMLLCVNVGSSSVKVAAYRTGDGEPPVSVAAGSFEAAGGAAAAVTKLLKDPALCGQAPDAIAHRIAFGGRDYVEPEFAGERVLADLETFVELDPLHLRPELDAVYALARRFSGTSQFLCFDTAFHRRLPPVAKRLPLPDDLDPLLERYGYHGLSYEGAVTSLGGPPGRAIVAHLGSGASLCALRDGLPVETTMGFSTLGGLVMATRPGDLDPGVLLRLLRARGYTAEELADLLYRRSGLLGASGCSGDMRVLLAARAQNPHARDAVDLFVHQLVKAVGAAAAVLGGLETLVFTGGIGEGAPEIRAATCSALAFLGLALDADANARSAPVVSAGGSRVVVRVLRSDENLAMARAVAGRIPFLRSSYPAASMTS